MTWDALVPLLVAGLAVGGVAMGHRFSRLRALEIENRELWFACKQLLHTLLVNGNEVPPELVALINGKTR